eukprot:5294768-Alexandrium_andersonii.AAC.1
MPPIPWSFFVAGKQVPIDRTAPGKRLAKSVGAKKEAMAKLLEEFPWLAEDLKALPHKCVVAQEGFQPPDENDPESSDGEGWEPGDDEIEAAWRALRQKREAWAMERVEQGHFTVKIR